MVAATDRRKPERQANVTNPRNPTRWGELRLPAGIAGIVAVIATAINYALRASTYKDLLTYSPNDMYVETAQEQAFGGAVATLVGCFAVTFAVVAVAKVVRDKKKQG